MELGISAGLSEALLAEQYPPQAEREVLQGLLAKAEQPPGSALEKRRLKAKIARRLLAKGFAQATVLEALEEWLPAPDYEYME
jgi:SOS response regulatory protein OraA/RecX